MHVITNEDSCRNISLRLVSANFSAKVDCYVNGRSPGFFITFKSTGIADMCFKLM